MLRSVFTAATLLATAGLAHADVIYATAYSGGIYEVDVDARTTTRISTIKTAWSIAGGRDASSLYFTNSNGNLKSLDLETGNVSTLGGSFTNNALARATDGYLYSGTWGNGTLLRIDPDTGAVTTVGDTGLAGFAGDLAPAADGSLFGLSTANEIVVIDPTNAAVSSTTALPAGVEAWGIATTYDGRFWISAASSLYEYDLNANTLTFAMSMGFDAYDLASTPGATFSPAVPAPATAVLMAGGLLAIPRRKRR